MTYDLSVENIKCGGCANTITSKLNALDIIDSCEVDIENGVVTINGDESNKAEVTQLLLKLGYPEKGTAEGLKAAKAKAKSFVSCAVGRMKESH
ncbi:MAG: heavy-metal-associated domain-containing protein [Gammaproteobacteria bacterium]|nr:heavy-metal-associated domain-containing protein [Gammaproteobacteria bacterium]